MNIPTDGASESRAQAIRTLATSSQAATIIVGLAGLLSAAIAIDHQAGGLTQFALYLALKQDIPFGIILILLLMYLRGLPVGPSHRLVVEFTPRRLLGIFVVFSAFIWLARAYLLFNFDLSRDEKMVTFDERIFSAGRLYWPIPEAFRPYYSALNPMFILPIGDREGWVSAYLPVNAALRALIGFVAPPSLISPLLVLLSGLLLWSIARRIWPRNQITQIVVLFCFLGSSQVVLTGTTNYAMNAHLALNLVWLRLFIQKSPGAHVAALCTGFFATGLHQPLFHPLFVLPFLDLLRQDKRWRELLFYCVGYTLIGLFWLSWPGLIAASGSNVPPPEINPAGIGFFERLVRTVWPITLTSISVMSANVLRFLTWQHVLLFPLLIIGIRTLGRSDPFVRALALGIGLLLVTMTLLLPPQGHGWGYRYLHGFLGSACLLAGYGWHWLEERQAAPIPAMVAATLASLFIALPVHVWMARNLIGPPAEISHSFKQVTSDFMIVENAKVPFGPDLVINDPDLSNRPILLLGTLVKPSDISTLCRMGSVAFADAPFFNDLTRTYYSRSIDEPGSHQMHLHKMAEAEKCRIVPYP